MQSKIIKIVLYFIFILGINGCSGFFEKDNTPAPTPLKTYQPEITPRMRWSLNVGAGVGNEYLKVGPTIGNHSIYTTSNHGTVSSVNKETGQFNWHINTGLPMLTTPGVGNGIVVVGNYKGEILGLSESNGQILWRSNATGEVLAEPKIKHDTVVLKTVDGTILALSAKNGQQLWATQQEEPNLILHGASAPLIVDGHTIVGFANGHLAQYDLVDGNQIWLTPIANPSGGFSIQRMIDIDADPILFDHRLYAATYQGKIASLDLRRGKILWSHDLSSYTGMVADEDTVYISDAKSHVWALDADSGLVKWRQSQLQSRGVTGPAVMGNYIVVGDSEGYLHWLNKTDGHISARVSVGASFYAAPIVSDHMLYAINNRGYLVAYSLG